MVEAAPFSLDSPPLDPIAENNIEQSTRDKLSAALTPLPDLPSIIELVSAIDGPDRVTVAAVAWRALSKSDNSNAPPVHFHSCLNWLRAQATPCDFSFVRIGHLATPHALADDSSGTPVIATDDWGMGVFAACPIAQAGCVATFHYFSVGPRLGFVHSSNSSEMAG